MSDFSSEQRLRLIHTIREEHRNNQLSMQNRERILNGDKIVMPLSDNTMEKNMNEPAGINTGSFKLRFMIAIILFIGFIFMDSQKISLNGINALKIQNSITENFQSNIFDFMESIPYTLESMQEK